MGDGTKAAVLLPEWDEYDIEEAFKYLGNGLGWADVAKVVASTPGENDEKSWLAVGQLHDGRWFALAAWCDYTGWGCQEGGWSNVGKTIEDETHPLTVDNDFRDRLGPILADAGCVLATSASQAGPRASDTVRYDQKPPSSAPRGERAREHEKDH